MTVYRGHEWIYLMHAADGTVVYIGRTRKPRQRAAAHRRESTWWPQVTSISWRRYSTEMNAWWAERVLIARHRPIGNRNYNPDVTGAHKFAEMVLAADGGRTA
jgi:excinuclease UvrABC nuclease subunit